VFRSAGQADGTRNTLRLSLVHRTKEDAMNSFPLDPSGLLDPTAAALLAGLLAQWLKAYLPNWRYTNLLVLALAVAAELAAAALTGQNWWSAGWAGFLGASVATFGYEAIQNLSGAAGLGARALDRRDPKAHQGRLGTDR
jgi:hypothetical protein